MLLGSQTGAEKTELVQALASAGAQAVDLADPVQQRGSAFGNIGLGDQPTQQNFENGLAQPGSQDYRTFPVGCKRRAGESVRSRSSSQCGNRCCWRPRWR